MIKINVKAVVGAAILYESALLLVAWAVVPRIFPNAVIQVAAVVKSVSVTDGASTT